MEHSSQSILKGQQITARCLPQPPNGSYSVPLLSPGEYRVDISKSGFRQLNFASVRVIVTETERLDVRIEVGMVSENVTVMATTEELQTASSALGRLTNEEMVTNLPLVTRN